MDNLKQCSFMLKDFSFFKFFKLFFLQVLRWQSRGNEGSLWLSWKPQVSKLHVGSRYVIVVCRRNDGDSDMRFLHLWLGRPILGIPTANPNQRRPHKWRAEHWMQSPSTGWKTTPSIRLTKIFQLSQLLWLLAHGTLECSSIFKMVQGLTGRLPLSARSLHTSTSM